MHNSSKASQIPFYEGFNSIQVINTILFSLLLIIGFGCSNSHDGHDQLQMDAIKSSISQLEKNNDAFVWPFAERNQLSAVPIFTIEMENTLLSKPTVLFYSALKDIYRKGGEHVAVFEQINIFMDVESIFLELSCTAKQIDSLLYLHKLDTSWSGGYVIVAKIESVKRFRLSIEAWSDDYEMEDDLINPIVTITPGMSPIFLVRGRLIDFIFYEQLGDYLFSNEFHND